MSDSKNLKKIRTNLPRTPSKTDDEVLDVNAVLFDELHVPAYQDLLPVVKSRLQAEAEHITMGQVGDKLVYANSGGHGILEELRDIKNTLTIQNEKYQQKNETYQQKNEMYQQKFDEHQEKISSLEGRVRNLVLSSEDYLKIRRRFLDVYKTDVKVMEGIQGSKAIREGNMTAHEGDALGDAVLFERDHRTDNKIYRELYGLDYLQVLESSAAKHDGELFLVLNAHANMVAQGNPLPDDLKIAFDSFLTQVEEHWLQPLSKEPNTPLGSAYYTFWKIYNHHARD